MCIYLRAWSCLQPPPPLSVFCLSVPCLSPLLSIFAGVFTWHTTLQGIRASSSDGSFPAFCEAETDNISSTRIVADWRWRKRSRVCSNRGLPPSLRAPMWTVNPCTFMLLDSQYNASLEQERATAEGTGNTYYFLSFRTDKYVTGISPSNQPIPRNFEHGNSIKVYAALRIARNGSPQRACRRCELAHSEQSQDA